MFFPSLGLIATTDVIKVDIHENISEALKKMHEYNHRSIVVVNGSLHYIITSKDIINFRLNGIDFSTPLSQMELRMLPTLDKESNVINALNLTHEMDEHICVCNENGTLYGLVTNSDIVASVDPQVILDTLQIGTIFDKKFGYRSVDAHMTMDQILLYMKDGPTDCAIITEHNKPVGIITSKDVLGYIDDPSCHTVQAHNVMSYPIETLLMSTTIADALEFIKERHYKRIVVTNDEGEIVGIISQQDLISRTYLKWSQLVHQHFEQFEELNKILQQKNRHLTALATVDPLTSVHNRHMFGELFAKELAIMKRYETPLSIVMMDLDYFKRINDTYGHNIGDYVLKEFAQMVVSTVREADLFARWGGEEFVLLLRNAGCKEAFLVGEKIRNTLQNYSFEQAGTITCSIGIAQVVSTDSIEEAVERADKALYEAKNSGRNRTVTCEVLG